MTTTELEFDQLPIWKDIVIKQGATVTMYWTYEDEGSAVDLSTYSAKLTIKTDYNGDTIDTRESGGSGITLSSAGVVTVVWSAAQTAAIVHTRGVYDLKLTSAGGVVTYLSEGYVTVVPRVTS